MDNDFLLVLLKNWEGSNRQIVWEGSNMTLEHSKTAFQPFAFTDLKQNYSIMWDWNKIVLLSVIVIKFMVIYKI